MINSLQATVPATFEHEIILVDDGSTDGTRDWLKTLAQPPFKILLNECNLGYAGANNRAAAAAGGEFLVLLNNDLELTSGWLEPMLALHGVLAKPGIIGNVQLNAASGAVDHAGIFVTAKGKPEHDVQLPRTGTGKLSPAVTGACALTARSLWQELGGFDPEFMNGGEDIDLCFRAAKKGLTNAVALRSVVRHHVSASPGRKQYDVQNAYRLTLRWKDELIQLGVPAWCRHHVRHTPYLETLSLPAILFFLLGLRQSPPVAAIRGMTKNVDHSLAIWAEAFGPEAAVTRS